MRKTRKEKELTPELHDLLKLTTLKHDISAWDDQDYRSFEPFFPSTKTWQGVKQHHCSDWCEMGFPTEPDTLYLCIADDLASHVSRLGITVADSTLLEEEALHCRVNKLWKPLEVKAKDIRLQDGYDIISLLKFCSADPSWEEFLKQYESILKNRAEDAHRGRNITSLYTHCKLTGQFYRILKSSPKYLVTQSELDGKSREQMKALINDITVNRWQLTVARCKFHFLQKPFRARDLNVFGALEELVEEIGTSYPDSIFFNTSDEILLILSDEAQLSDIATKAHHRGFWVEIARNQRPVRELHPEPESMAKATLKRENLYNLPHEISPPICELCQSARATKHWPDDYVLSCRELCPNCRELLSQNPLASVVALLCEADRARLEDIIEEPAREELCGNCFSLRAEETKLPKLDRWAREGETKVAWLKLNLGFAELVSVLKELYLSRFVSSFPSEKAEIRFSVVGEFQEDYSHFLWEFSRRLGNKFGDDSMETILSDFFCIRVKSFGETFGILRVYRELLEEFFPAFLDLEECPLRIAIACADIKFPFFLVWKILEGGQGDIFISLQGRRTMRAPAKALRALIKAANMQCGKSALYKLARIEEVSGTLAEITFQNKKDEDHRTYSSLANALRPALDFSSIFTLARLMGD